MKAVLLKIKNQFIEPAENQNLFIWFHRGLGLVYLCALFPLFFQIKALLGEDGLSPSENLLHQSYSDQGFIKSFLQFPSLFHFFPHDEAFYILIALGCIGALMLISGIQLFLGSVLAWSAFLSITTIGSDFFVIIIDLFLSEVGFLSMFSAYALQHKKQIPKIVAFAFRFLNFRLWFCMGINKFYLPASVWTDFTFFNYFFHAQPMPTALSPILERTPLSIKYLTEISFFLSEIVVPFFVFGNKKCRLFSFYTFLIVSVIIELSGNYGYFNILSIVLALLILKDTDVKFFTSKNISVIQSNTHKFSILATITLSYQIILQIIYCINVFNPKPHSPQNQFNYLFTTKHYNHKTLEVITEPFKWPEYWRICNPYGVFKGIPYYHGEIKISGSNDSLNWKTYQFKYLPSTETDYLGFFAPYYPRLDHLFFYETLAAQNYKWNPLNPYSSEKNAWAITFINHLFENNSNTTQLLQLNPFQNQKAPEYIKIEVYRLSFSFDKNKNWAALPMNITKVYSKKTKCNAPLLTFKEAMKTTYDENFSK